MNAVALFLLTLGFLWATVSNLPIARETVLVDLYTQYSPPWGGHGLHLASDAFPPQSVVELRANVTFQGDGVPGKLVSYAIRAPNGETYSATSFTQADGVALFEYSLPGLDDYFGRWAVEASVDFAGRIVCDSLHFLVGWLVEVSEVKIAPIAHKGETMGINVTLTRICMQDPRDIMSVLLKDPGGNKITDSDLLLCVTGTDEVKQPFETSELELLMIAELDIYDLDDFVKAIGEQWTERVEVILTQYSGLTNMVKNEIIISPYSFSGKATIHASIFTGRLGTAYCPEGSGCTWITSQSGLDRNCEANIEVNRMVKAFGAEYSKRGGMYWHDPSCECCPHDPILDMNADEIINVYDVVLLDQNLSQ